MAKVDLNKKLMKFLRKFLLNHCYRRIIITRTVYSSVLLSVIYSIKHILPITANKQIKDNFLPSQVLKLRVFLLKHQQKTCL
jgi:hypothetical protein